MKIKLSTDSTADIPKEYHEQLNIAVLPLSIRHNDQEWRDGVDITPKEFYKVLDAAKVLPQSSQVPLPLYAELFEKTLNEGYTDLVHVSINSKGSGTYQAALLSREMFYDTHPEAKGKLEVHIIDSRTYSMAYGIGVIEAGQMIQSGAGVDEVIKHIRDWLDHTRPLFVPLNLKCVKKSGRISPAAAFVGDAIGLKPLITFEDGEPKILDKARGESKAIQMLLERCKRERKPGTNYAIVYGNNDEAYAKFKEMCKDVMDRDPIAEYEVGCIISINTGPNMIGILYRT